MVPDREETAEARKPSLSVAQEQLSMLTSCPRITPVAMERELGLAQVP